MKYYSKSCSSSGSNGCSSNCGSSNNCSSGCSSSNNCSNNCSSNCGSTNNSGCGCGNGNSACNTTNNVSYSCCEYLKGNSVNIRVQDTDCQIKADICVDRRSSVRLWGQVKDCNGCPIENALLKLIKQEDNGCYVGCAHTVSDCEGFYQFDLPECMCDSNFKIIVSKSTMGCEREVTPNNCNPCTPQPCICKRDPCICRR